MHKLKDEAVTRETQLLAARKGCKLVSFVGPVLVRQSSGEVIMSEMAGITQTLLARWLREGHKIYVWVEPDWENFVTNKGFEFGFYGVILHHNKINNTPVFNNYEMGMEEALKFALNLLPDITTAPDAKTDTP